MTPSPRRPLLRAGAALLALSALALLGLAASRSAGLVGAQPGTVYEWTEVGRTSQSLFHRAAAYDADASRLYLYGGLDVNAQVRGALDAADLSGATLDDVQMDNNLRPLGPIANLYGAAGAVRGGKAYFIGGTDAANDPYEGVQVYAPEESTWTIVRPTGRFDRRLFHGAVHVPSHDLILVQGGTESCELYPDVGEARCEDPYAGTDLLRFGSGGEDLSWERGPTGPRLFGHSLAWDADEERVLLYGGTYDFVRGESDVWALDLSGADPQGATWERLEVAEGPAPAGRAFHAASYDADGDRLIVYGGVTRTIYRRGEVVAAPETWALDLSQSPPAWELLGAAAGDRVGAAAAYAGKHDAPLLYGGRGRVREGRQTVSSELLALRSMAAPTPRPTPSPTPGPTFTPMVCPGLSGRVPSAVIADALANPAKIGGWGEPQNPSLPPGPSNPPRVWLTVRNPGVPYAPLANDVLYRAGCQ